MSKKHIHIHFTLTHYHIHINIHYYIAPFKLLYESLTNRRIKLNWYNLNWMCWLISFETSGELRREDNNSLGWTLIKIIYIIRYLFSQMECPNHYKLCSWKYTKVLSAFDCNLCISTMLDLLHIPKVQFRMIMVFSIVLYRSSLLSIDSWIFYQETNIIQTFF